MRRRRKQYERLAAGSLFSANIKNYSNKATDLKKQIENVTMTKEEEYAINQYISSESYKINEKLRNGVKLDDLEKDTVNNLDSALDKMQDYKGFTKRSLQLDEKDLEEFLQKHKIGNIVNYKAYTSTTAGGRYNDLSNIELIIKSKSGKDIRPFNKEEAEILFKRNTKFKVRHMEEIENTYYVELEELNE